MTSTPVEDVLRELAKLRAEFARDTAGMVSEIDQNWRLCSAAPTREELITLAALAHRLAGTAGTFAFQELSLAATCMENELMKVTTVSDTTLDFSPITAALQQINDAAGGISAHLS